MKPISCSAKNTFNNLPDGKRNRILAEAVREFASQGFQKASVNAIVRRVGIAKGSLYQYFASKEALFFYVFEQFTILVKETVRASAAQELERDLFSRVRGVLEAGIKFIDQHPDYYQVYLKVLAEQDLPAREVLLSQVRLFSVEYFGPFCNEARQQGLIRSDLPDQLVFFMLDAVLDRFLQDYARSFRDAEVTIFSRASADLEKNVALIISMLRHGLSGEIGGRSEIIPKT